LGASWSPSLEVLVVSTGKSKLLLLNTAFEPINEVEIDDDSQKVIDEPISIFWKNDAKVGLINEEIY